MYTQYIYNIYTKNIFNIYTIYTKNINNIYIMHRLTHNDTQFQKKITKYLQQKKILKISCPACFICILIYVNKNKR